MSGAEMRNETKEQATEYFAWEEGGVRDLHFLLFEFNVPELLSGNGSSR